MVAKANAARNCLATQYRLHRWDRIVDGHPGQPQRNAQRIVLWRDFASSSGFQHMSVTQRQLADAVRMLAVDAVEAANSGHPGMPMGMADVATVLFSEFLKFDPQRPDWADRDRFVLSAGHGSMLIYALLHLTGYARPTLDDIRHFRQLHSPCAGHPESFELPGVETTTGPLGQGLATAVGMGIAERHLNAIFGDDLVNHRTWVIAGDGCLMEGINHEAIGLAGHLQLGHLNVLWDDNRITIDGSTELSTSEDIAARYTATGWHVTSCDGHDANDVRRALTEAAADPRPSLVACRTIIGYGAPNKQGTSATHGSPLGSSEALAVRAFLNWSSEPFEVPEEIATKWRNIGQRGKPERDAWERRLAEAELGPALSQRLSGSIAPGQNFHQYLAKIAAEAPTVATRKASENALTALTADIPSLIGGSADLTGSNNTKTSSTVPLTRENYAGRYIYYGIREFGMAAAMNGMALHGGTIPYGGTFLVFADYCRPAIRLSALQQQRVVYVMTHDSIGLGEDGPTHQPVEHLASLRAMPNLQVFRPADAVETAESWALALASTSTPSVLALSRQNLPAVRHDIAENLCSKGAYRLKSAKAERQVVIIATGSEVHLALAAAELLEQSNIGVDIVSMPCAELFDAQPQAYQADILPAGPLLVSVEAASTYGWERYVGRDGLCIGLDRFGASAPADQLFEHFGFTASAVAHAVSNRLNG
jgi:transketolase